MGRSTSWSPTGIYPWSSALSDFINKIVKHILVAQFVCLPTIPVIIVDVPDDAARILNADLKTISQWANAWLVTFNASKTLSMIFSRKSNPVHYLSLFMNGTIIEETTRHKHLGLTFSSTCTWTDHVNTISDKAWTRLNFLRALKFRVSRKSLEKIYIYIYISYIRPLLEYSDSVWDNCSPDSRKQLEAIHTEAARVIVGVIKLCSIEKLLTDLVSDSSKSQKQTQTCTSLQNTPWSCT